MKLLLILSLLAGSLAFAADPQPDRSPKSPAFKPVTDDPKLPRVLLIGDSISIDYTIGVRKLLEGKANVHRIPENGGPTKNGIEKIDAWLGSGKWDLIHFNWGLHDLKIMDDGRHQVPIDEYEKNLLALVQKMKATGAHLIWASTTPVPAGELSPKRHSADAPVFNAAARKIMENENVEINDLFAFVEPRLEEFQIARNVHFKDKGSAALAERVAAAVEAGLKKAGKLK
ncbi:MAG TPA: SGNH/GDSL hydrolase family protein [Planctomycetota bacterium]|nr:SGNH/GDSL hydrolase family protein [Planctomycetota bacterium]